MHVIIDNEYIFFLLQKKITINVMHDLIAIVNEQTNSVTRYITMCVYIYIYI